MIRQTQLAKLKMDTLENYFEWIADVAQTGEMPFPEELINDLGVGQKRQLINWCNDSTELYPVIKNTIIKLVNNSFNK